MIKFNLNLEKIKTKKIGNEHNSMLLRKIQPKNKKISKILKINMIYELSENTLKNYQYENQSTT